MRLHATGVARHGAAALLTGPPGAGKSDLALRLIDRGWALIGDDQLWLEAVNGRLIAAGAPAIAGRIELRGLGIFAAAAVSAPAPVVLIAALGPEPERLPEPAFQTLLGVTTPLVRLDPRPASAPIRLEHAFARARGALWPAPR